MSLVAHFRLMARNNAWSNGRVLDACGRLTRDDLMAKRTSFFPSLHATLNHILAVDRYYIDALTEGGRGPSAFRDFVPFDDVASLRRAQEDSDRALIAFCDAERDESLSRTVLTDRGEAGVYPERLDRLLAHLFLHQIHHRGQAHAMLAGTSVPPPQLDEYFLEFDRSARAGDLAALRLEGPDRVT